MKKVAFLVLAYESFTQPDHWRRFFANADKNSYNLYIHSKHRPRCFFSKFFISRHIPTAWGHFSLVEATIELMKEALKDPENEHFVLISDSHFPLHNAKYIIEKIKKNFNGLFFSPIAFNNKIRVEKNYENQKLYSRYVCQFFICKREHAQKFVESFDFFSGFFPQKNLDFSDEFYFVAVSNFLKLKYSLRQNACHIGWNIINLKNGKRIKVPLEYKCLNEEMIKQAGRRHLFIRKIMQNTQITYENF